MKKPDGNTLVRRWPYVMRGATLWRAWAAAFTILVIIYSLASAQSYSYRRFDRQLNKKEEKQIRQTLAALTLEEKIGQMIMVNSAAVFMNRDSDEYNRLRHRVVDNKVGGVILSRSQVWATAILTNRLQQMAKVPLLTAAD